MKQALASGFFSSICLKTKRDVWWLIMKQPFFFILNYRQGFGRWLWKPYLILEQLKTLDDGDFLVYCDAGVHIQGEGKRHFHKFIAQMIQSESNVGVFETGSAYKSRSYVRAQVVRDYFPQFNKLQEPQVTIKNYVYGGIIFLRKSASTLIAMREWYKLCQRYLPKEFGAQRFLPHNYFWRHANQENFIGQDADNGYLPLVLEKNGGFTIFSGQHVNLYNEEGLQLKHVLAKREYDKIDWTPLIEEPFTYRRDFEK